MREGLRFISNTAMDIQKYLPIFFTSILVLMLIAWFLYLESAENEEQIAYAVNKRYQSFLLADELRQSFDDLTRLARMYVVTANPKYKEYFDRVLSIRNGEAPRPLNYHNVYWDFIIATGVSPRVDTEPKSLKQLMKEAEFAEVEFALLQETEEMSNDLVALETRAMNAMVGIFQDNSGHQITTAPNHELARSLMYSEQYNKSKQKVMAPLKQFIETVDYRTSEEIAIYTDKQRRLNIILTSVLGLSACIAMVALALVLIILRRKSISFSKSRLARRLSDSGYAGGGAGAGRKHSARDELIKRLTSKPTASVAGSDQDPRSEATSLVYPIRIFWNNWPLIIGSLFVAFVAIGISWELLSENRSRLYAKTRNELKFSLDNTMRAVDDWLSQMSQDTAIFADTVRNQITDEMLHSLKADPHHRLHQQLTATVLLELGDMSEGPGPDMLAATPTRSDAEFAHIIVDTQGIILSSSDEELIGHSFRPSPEMMARIRAKQVAISFPNRETDDELLAQNIVFGALIDELKGSVFVIVPPQQTLTKILRRGYIGNYGEIYLVDARGRFISEPRWQEDLYEYRNTEQSVIGSYANQSGSGSAELPLAVRSVIQGEISPALREYDNYLDERVIGLWEWNNTYGFGIIDEFKAEDALATFKAFQKQAIAGSGFTIGLFLILTLVAIWSRYKVTRTNEQLKGAFKTIKVHNDKLDQDLRIGQKVQMDMLPDPIQGEGFTLDAHLKPAQSVSGDFYDFSQIQDGKIYFCVGDVSGKGIPASLFMSVTKSLLNKILDQTDQTKDIVDRVNHELSQNNESNMFVTLIIGIIDMHTGKLLLTNAGHNLPYIKKHNGELVCLDKVQGPLVGTFEGIEFEQQTIEMEVGDILLLYTDGVTEALNIRDEFYDDERLVKLLEDRAFKSAHEMTNGVYRNVLRFIGRAEQFDDITILSFQYNGLE